VTDIIYKLISFKGGFYMMNNLKSSLKGIVNTKLFLTLNKNERVLIVQINGFLNNVEKHYITKQAKKVNSDLQVFFR